MQARALQILTDRPLHDLHGSTSVADFKISTPPGCGSCSRCAGSFCSLPGSCSEASEPSALPSRLLLEADLTMCAESCPFCVFPFCMAACLGAESAATPFSWPCVPSSAAFRSNSAQHSECNYLLVQSAEAWFRELQNGRFECISAASSCRASMQDVLGACIAARMRTAVKIGKTECLKCEASLLAKQLSFPAVIPKSHTSAQFGPAADRSAVDSLVLSAARQRAESCALWLQLHIQMQNRCWICQAATPQQYSPLTCLRLLLSLAFPLFCLLSTFPLFFGGNSPASHLQRILLSFTGSCLALLAGPSGCPVGGREHAAGIGGYGERKASRPGFLQLLLPLPELLWAGLRVAFQHQQCC